MQSNALLNAMLSDTCNQAAEGGQSDNEWADSDDDDEDVLWTLSTLIISIMMIMQKDFAEEDENDIDEEVHLKPSSCSNKGTDGIY